MPKNYKESLREEFLKLNIIELSYGSGEKYKVNLIDPKYANQIATWWLDKLETQVQYAVAEERKRMVEIEKQKLAPITHIHANFNGNGLVEETANKINELVDAINVILIPTSNKK